MSVERKQITLEEAKELTKNFIVDKYGEPVYDRWVKNTTVSIRPHATKANGLLESIMNCGSLPDNLEKVITDYELYENGVVIGRMNIAESIDPTKHYYLVKILNIPILYELSNLTKLVPTLVSMPDAMMVGVIISGINKSFFDGGHNHENSVPVVVYNKDNKPIPVSTYLEDGEEAVLHLLVEGDENTAKEAIRMLMLKGQPDINKQYMLISSNVDEKHYYIEVINGLSNFFPMDSYGIIGDFIALQALTYQYKNPSLSMQ